MLKISISLIQLFTKKYQNFKAILSIIKFIRRISIIGLSVGVAALIIVLSIMNGFEDYIFQNDNLTQPDLLITPKMGRTMTLSAKDIQTIQKLSGASFIFPIVQDKVLLRFKDIQKIINLKGIPKGYFERILKPNHFIQNVYPNLNTQDTPYAILTPDLSYQLNINLSQDYHLPIWIYALNKKNQSNVLADNFNALPVYFDDIYASPYNDKTDNTLFTNRDFCSFLLNLDSNTYSSVEVYGTNIDAKILSKIYPKANIQTKIEQNSNFYKVIQREKWIVIIILYLIILMTAFNLFGSIIMLIIEKQKDIIMLFSIGISKASVFAMFWLQGVIICLKGLLWGLLLGYFIVFLQWHFEILKLEGDSFIINSYPVHCTLADFLFIVLSIVALSVMMNLIPAYFATKINKKILN